MDYKLKGTEVFCLHGEPTEMNILDFWRWHFCERFDLQDKIAEYIVAKALGLNTADNVGVWTLYDILYREKRIEVKETSYLHAWQSDEDPKSKTRIFGINKAYSKYQDNTSEYKRQSDIYVFCLNIGETRQDADPLQLENWEFYIVPTSKIDEMCDEAKTISLSRVRKMVRQCPYEDIKSVIDNLIDLNSFQN